MIEFVQTWEFPQWCLLALVTFQLLLASGWHGDEMIHKYGAEKGKVMKYSFPIRFMRSLVLLVLLTLGGFFGGR